MRRHPHLYELSAWPWLERLSRRHGRLIDLGTVPSSEWDRLADLGFDLVYLMGVWERSAIGREIARSDEAQQWTSAVTKDGETAMRDLVWVLVNCHEFRFVR